MAQLGFSAEEPSTPTPTPKNLRSSRPKRKRDEKEEPLQNEKGNKKVAHVLPLRLLKRKSSELSSLVGLPDEVAMPRGKRQHVMIQTSKLTITLPVAS